MTDYRRYIVYSSQGGVDDADPPGGDAGAGDTGDTQDPGQAGSGGQSPGQAKAGGGSQDPGKSGPDSKDLADAIWAKASNHFQPKIKALEKELAKNRQERQAAEVKAKSAEQLAAENDDLRTTLERQSAVASAFADNRVKALPEHLQKIVTKASGGDPIKTLELLPDLEDMARRTQLKTIGGSTDGNGKPNIDYASIREAQNRGDTRLYSEAVKQHGKKAYQDGLLSWIAERGQ